MKVFISWSGDRSKAVADLLDEWIQCVLQAVDPWMSSKDIDRGSLWFSEISDQLKDTNIGIICLTQDNKNKPWILFESGALAKGLSSTRVCTFLVDLEPTDIGNPLAQFNHTQPNREGVFELIGTLNRGMGEHALREKVLERVFDTYWPQFEQRFQEALDRCPAGTHEPPRSDENMMVEVLRAVRSMEQRVRKLDMPTIEIDETFTAHRLPPFRSLEKKIYRYIRQGLPVEVVEDKFRDEAPTEVIREFIHRAIRKAERGESGTGTGDE